MSRLARTGRLRQGDADQNVSHVRKLVLALLKLDRTAELGIETNVSELAGMTTIG